MCGIFLDVCVFSAFIFLFKQNCFRKVVFDDCLAYCVIWLAQECSIDFTFLIRRSGTSCCFLFPVVLSFLFFRETSNINAIGSCSSQIVYNRFAAYCHGHSYCVSACSSNLLAICFLISFLKKLMVNFCDCVEYFLMFVSSVLLSFCSNKIAFERLFLMIV